MKVVTVDPWRTARHLWIVAAALAAANAAGVLITALTGHDNVRGLIPLFSLGQEQNIPTLFAVFLLLFAALLLATAGELARQRGDSLYRWWVILMCLFVWLATDEGWAIHERLIKPLRSLLPWTTHGAFHFAWVIPALAVVLVATAPLCTALLRRLPRGTAASFVLAASIYLGGAIGCELIEGVFMGTYGPRSTVFAIVVMIEECMEMAGVIVFIQALMRYIATIHGDVTIRFGGEDQEQTAGADREAG